MKKIISMLFSGMLAISSAASLSAAAFEPYETYSYDRWGDAVPSQAGYTAERAVSGYDLGIGAMDSPSDIFYAFDDNFYIADTGNNRIIAVNGDMNEVVRVYDSFTMPDGSQTKLKSPAGIFVSPINELMYIADSDNSRVLISDTEGNVIQEIGKPQSEIYDKDKTFLPQRVIADKAGNVYVVLKNITTGAAMFAPDGTFSGFYGANRVQPTAEIIRDSVMNLFMSEEKCSLRTRNIPSGITSFDIDGDFIFTCTSSSTQSTDTVKKLNAAGNNIFADLELSFGDYTPMYDTSQNRLLSPAIVDIDIAEDGNINCLDFTTGRIFQYDKDCNLLFITGTIAKQVGGFDHAAAVESRGNKLFVVDSQKDTITVFAETEFGSIVHKASALHNGGYYEEALGPWLEVLKRDGNYRRAYLGAAAAKLRAGEYREAMKYAKAADAQSIYGKAFEGWRTEFLKENLGLIMLVIILALLIAFEVKQHRRHHPAPTQAGKEEQQNDGS